MLLPPGGCARSATGFVSLLLPVYLLASATAPFEIGVDRHRDAGRLGAAHAAGRPARPPLPRRAALLLGAALLMALTGARVRPGRRLLAAAPRRLRRHAQPVGGRRQRVPAAGAGAARPARCADRDRTALFARYSLVGIARRRGGRARRRPARAACGGSCAAGSRPALRGGVPALRRARAGRPAPLPPPARARSRRPDERRAQPLGRSRRIVLTLAALFSLDAFAGGLVVQSLLALWLFQRFGLSLATPGVIFFWTGLLSALSYLAAAPHRAADRARQHDGVHAPAGERLPRPRALRAEPRRSRSRCCSCAARSRRWTCRPAPPTSWRWSSRASAPAAASVTAVPRSLAAAASPRLPALLAASGFGWPLVLAGGLKIAYDLLCWRCSGTVRPPEETAGRSRP